MGALGSYLNMGEQQEHDAYICEIPAGKQTEPQHHMFETLVYIHKGRGATTVWFEGDAKQTFEWAAGAIFAIPLNVSYQHFNASNEPVRFLAGTNAPHVINLFHNEDFIFRNPFQFRDRFRPDREFFNENKKLTIRSWESNMVPDVNEFALDDYPLKAKGVKIMLPLERKKVSRPDMTLPPANVVGNKPFEVFVWISRSRSPPLWISSVYTGVSRVNVLTKAGQIDARIGANDDGDIIAAHFTGCNVNCEVAQDSR
jgi:mannose-6-phosphate isomerase-like protein (cupin superfamily)